MRAIVTAISEEDFEDYLLEKSAALKDVQAEFLGRGGVGLEEYMSKGKKRLRKGARLLRRNVLGIKRRP